MSFMKMELLPPCPVVVVDDITCGKELDFEVDVKVQNVGNVDGTDFAIVYSKPPASIKELISNSTLATPIDGFSAYGNVIFVNSCGNDTSCTKTDDFPAAVEVAKNADATIIIVGLDLKFEREEQDRADLKVPGHQIDLVNQVANAAKGPVILVIMLQDALNSMSLRLVPEFGYPGRTYKFFNGETLYPFGYGLSYSQFNYSMVSSAYALNLKLGKLQHCYDVIYEDGTTRPPCPVVVVDDITCGKELDFEVDVKVHNVGNVDGTDFVIVYSKPPASIKELISNRLLGSKGCS
ncbi:putative beta-D-xylosidase [Macadamia integrifolia]|uniref:putative beta-D-xylosidase n=1 Tax=Macadamia integrifolia TaxID=60698 RepID=UPI001C4FB30E|nr:putative beta-D-xylosidase [Macadamia integrifolia]